MLSVSSANTKPSLTVVLRASITVLPVINILLLKKYNLGQIKNFEGFLFPDTYYFTPSMKADDVVCIMVDNFFKKISQMEGFEYVTIERMYHLLRLASIVEREYRVKEEAPLIASVFANRLRRTIGLYSCATVEYIITEIEGRPHPDVITYKDLKIEKIVCANTNGEIKSTICTAQRKGFDLCPATSGAKDLLIKEYNKICASNIDYLQALDQNHGGCPCFCYSDNHGHVPAPGRWQQEETNKMLESINKNGVLFGCESAASEPFLKELKFSDNRFELNYYLGEAVPIYSYIFHEYVNNFMGNQICSMLEKKDNCFTYRLGCCSSIYIYFGSKIWC
mgnify:CR=1 FL=1